MILSLRDPVVSGSLFIATAVVELAEGLSEVIMLPASWRWYPSYSAGGEHRSWPSRGFLFELFAVQGGMSTS